MGSSLVVCKVNIDTQQLGRVRPRPKPLQCRRRCTEHQAPMLLAASVAPSLPHGGRCKQWPLPASQSPAKARKAMTGSQNGTQGACKKKKGRESTRAATHRACSCQHLAPRHPTLPIPVGGSAGREARRVQRHVAVLRHSTRVCACALDTVMQQREQLCGPHRPQVVCMLLQIKEESPMQ